MSYTEKSASSIVFQPPQMNDDEVFDEEEDDTYHRDYANVPSASINIQISHSHIKQYTNDDSFSIIDAEYQLPCPQLRTKCPSIISRSCCCFWSKSDRKQFALELIYNRYYKILYVLIIILTLILLIFDIGSGNMFHLNLINEPLWFLCLDIFVILLMIIDLQLQMQSSTNYASYFRSKWNVFDFITILICILIIPVFVFVSDIVLTIVILIRFISRLVRMYVIFKHEKQRKEYINARDSIVDFSEFDHIQESFKDHFDPGIDCVSKDMKFIEYGIENIDSAGSDENDGNEEKEKVIEQKNVYQIFDGE